jgi:hypothetical protein
MTTTVPFATGQDAIRRTRRSAVQPKGKQQVSQSTEAQPVTGAMSKRSSTITDKQPTPMHRITKNTMQFSIHCPQTTEA